MNSSTVAPLPAEGQSADTAAVLRDCRALYLKELGQLLREAERLPDTAHQVFLQTVGSYFDEMVSNVPRGTFSDADGLTASRITMVGDNDLELEIRLNEFSAKLLDKTGSDLWRVYLRFVTLLKRHDLPKEDNPVGPRGIAEGLAQMCCELAEGHIKTMARVERLQNFFANNLPVLYINLNALFQRCHVDAAQLGIIATPGAAKMAPVGASKPLPVLQESLVVPVTVPGNGGSARGNLSSQASMLDGLLPPLDQIDFPNRLPARAPMPAAEAGEPSLENLIPELFDLSSPSHPVPWRVPRAAAPAVPPETAVSATLAVVFAAISELPGLPDVIKPALASLQVPLLKAAMLDASFFANETHPGRTLLDRMARAALGLPADCAATHPVCQQILTVAAHVFSEFTNDPAVFTHYATELDALIAQRDEETAEAARAWLPLLARLDRQGEAKIRCQEVIDAFCRRGVPQGIADFLRTYWYRVLLQVLVEHGEESAAWLEHNSVIDSLLWSVQPKTEAEDRKRVSRMLPEMIQLLSRGMTQIEVPDDERMAFIDTCFALQASALRGLSQKPADNPPAAEALARHGSPLSAPSTRPEPGKICVGDLCLKTIDIPGESALLGRLRLLPIKLGDWLAFQLLDGTALVGRLSHRSLDSGKLLLCNSAWGFAVALHPAVMEHQLAAQQAQRLSSRSLFNLAPDMVLNSLPEL